MLYLAQVMGFKKESRDKIEIKYPRGFMDFPEKVIYIFLFLYKNRGQGCVMSGLGISCITELFYYLGGLLLDYLIKM